MLKSSQATRQYVAQRTAAFMCGLSLVFLAILATVIVLWVDVVRSPKAEEAATSSAVMENLPGDELPADKSTATHAAVQLGNSLAVGLEFLWPIFWFEFLLQFLMRNRQAPFWKRRYFGLIICVCPPLRLCARNHDMDGKSWLP